MKTKIYLLLILVLFTAVTISAKVKSEISKKVPDFIKIDKTKPGDAYFTFNQELPSLYEDKISQDWTDNAWVNDERSIFQWDFNAGKYDLLEMEWDIDNGVWINSMKFTVTFAISLTDSTFRFLGSEIYSWVETEWVTLAKSVYTFDSNDFLIEVTSSIDIGTGALIPYIKTTFTNNSVGAPLTEITQFLNFSTSLLENSERIIYTYQQANPLYLTEQIEADWDGSGWKDTSKVRYTRNSRLNPTEEIWSDIYGGTTVVDVNKAEYSYLPDGENLSSQNDYWWNVGSSSWENGSRFTYTYTTFNELDVSLIENFQNNAFIPWLRTTYTYNSMNQETEALTQEYTNSDYVNSYREITSYLPTSVGNEKTFVNGFVLAQNYPNPFNPTTNIEFQIQQREFVTLKVFDILGKEVATLVNSEFEPGSHSVNFDASNLSSGIYFYTIQSGNFNQAKKMVLMR